MMITTTKVTSWSLSDDDHDTAATIITIKQQSSDNKDYNYDQNMQYFNEEGDETLSSSSFVDLVSSWNNDIMDMDIDIDNLEYTCASISDCKNCSNRHFLQDPSYLLYT